MKKSLLAIALAAATLPLTFAAQNSAPANPTQTDSSQTTTKKTKSSKHGAKKTKKSTTTSSTTEKK